MGVTFHLGEDQVSGFEISAHVFLPTRRPAAARRAGLRRKGAAPPATEALRVTRGATRCRDKHTGAGERREGRRRHVSKGGRPLAGVRCAMPALHPCEETTWVLRSLSRRPWAGPGRPRPGEPLATLPRPPPSPTSHPAPHARGHDGARAPLGSRRGEGGGVQKKLRPPTPRPPLHPFSSLFHALLPDPSFSISLCLSLSHLKPALRPAGSPAAVQLLATSPNRAGARPTARRGKHGRAASSRQRADTTRHASRGRRGSSGVPAATRGKPCRKIDGPAPASTPGGIRAGKSPPSPRRGWRKKREKPRSLPLPAAGEVVRSSSGGGGAAAAPLEGAEVDGEEEKRTRRRRSRRSGWLWDRLRLQRQPSWEQHSYGLVGPA